MDRTYDHWTTRVVAGGFLLFLSAYLFYYVPHLFEAGTSFPWMTNILVPAIFASTLIYFFANRRLGHHCLVLIMVFLFGVSTGRQNDSAATFYGIALALLAIGVIRSRRRVTSMRGTPALG